MKNSCFDLSDDRIIYRLRAEVIPFAQKQKEICGKDGFVKNKKPLSIESGFYGGE